MNSSFFQKSSKIMCSFMLISTIITIVVLSKSYVNSEFIVSSSTSSSSSSSSAALEIQDDLQEMLNTEKVLIDNLRHFIGTQEQKLSFLKRKTLEIQNIHDGATDREKYLYNPINAITMLKRFTADWKGLTNYAEEYLNTGELTKNYTQQLQTLTFPTDDDYDTALANLLRIQDMYKLEPQHLSVGKVNGVKLGSEMSWSDCLEIGIKSSKNGYQTYAKYWIEAALEKLPTTNNNSNEEHLQIATGVKSPTPISTLVSSSSSSSSPAPKDDYTVKARIEIMKALLNIEYEMGNLEKALKIVNEILQIQPKCKITKTKKQIEKELKKNNANNNSNSSKNADDAKKQKLKNKKTDEELMIEEICREATNTQMNKQLHTASLNPSSDIPQCSIVTSNLPSLLLQPLQVELLSLDPYIVIYHNVLSDTQVKDLKDFVVEQDDMLEFTKIGHKKMRQFNGKLHYIIGHHGQDLYDDWQVDRYNFESLMELQPTTATSTTLNENASQAKILFNLQHPLLGGSIIFPQLDLSINLPKGSLLYWSTLNELNMDDYRSKYHICPVIGGTQLTAITSIKNL